LNAALRLTERPERPQYIIVETSGVSDPVQVAQTFLMPALRQWLTVDSILTVVDAEQLGTLSGANAYLAMEQMSVADIIVLNKVDLVTPDKIKALRREWLYPQARVIETMHGRVTLDLILGIGKFDPARLMDKSAADIHIHRESDDHDHADHSTVFSTWSWTADEPVSLNAIRKVSRELPTSIYRVKGFLYLADVPDRKAVLHVVGSRVKVTLEDEWGVQQPRNQLVLIGAYGTLDAAKLQQRFDSALDKNISPLGKAMGTVFEWMRGGTT
jgi:G3E family GTPase